MPSEPSRMLREGVAFSTGTSIIQQAVPYKEHKVKQVTNSHPERQAYVWHGMQCTSDQEPANGRRTITEESRLAV